MIIIDVKESIKNYTEKEFESFKGSKKKAIEGFIAENTVKDWYGAKLSRYGEATVADIILNNYSVDIKNDVCDMKYFESKKSYFTVQDRDDGKHSSLYLFTKYDPKAGKVALVGWLPYEEVIRCGVRYEKGDTINEFYGTTSSNGCYVISEKKFIEVGDNRENIHTVS